MTPRNAKLPYWRKLLHKQIEAKVAPEVYKRLRQETLTSFAMRESYLKLSFIVITQLQIYGPLFFGS